MRLRMVGAAAVFAVVSLAFVPAAGADSIRLTNTVLGPNQDVVPDPGSWANVDSFGGRFNAQSVNGQVSGRWEFETVNPFRDDAVQKGFQQIGMEEARRFLSSSHAASNAASLDFTVKQMGDRDADDMDDFKLTLTSGSFTTTDKLGVGPSAAGQPLPTPEPASMVLLGSGLAGLGFVGYRRKARRSQA